MWFQWVPVSEAESCPAQVLQTLVDSFNKQVAMLLGARHRGDGQGQGWASFCSNAQMFEDIQCSEGVCYTGLLRAM